MLTDHSRLASSSIGTRRARLVAAGQRDLDHEHAVLVARLRLRRPRRRRPARRTRRNGPVLDLDLLVEAALGLLGPALAGDHQLAAADLERRRPRSSTPARSALTHRARRVVRVVDVDARREPAPAEAGALEDVAEQLVDLAPHALEVREQVALAGHAAKVPGQLDGRRQASDLVDGALARDVDTGAPKASARPRVCAPQLVELVGDVGEHHAAWRRPSRACSPASSGVRWPRMPVRSGRGSVASIEQQVGARGELDQLLGRAASRRRRPARRRRSSTRP